MSRDTKTTVLPALTIDLLKEEGFSGMYLPSFGDALV